MPPPFLSAVHEKESFFLVVLLRALTASSGGGGHVPLRPPLGSGTSLQNTKAREKREIVGKFICLHRARVTAAYPNANYDTILDFPPKSADLNIIENILDELSYRCVWRKGAVPATLN